MKYLNALDDLLGQKSKVKILRYLVNTGLEMSGRQIASDIKMSPWACHRALQELTEQGVLLMRNVGRTYLFRLNEKNYLVGKLLLPLFQKEKGLLEAAIQEIVEEIPDATVSIVLYGSISRGDERPSSDFDLLILVPTKANKEPVQEVFDRKNDSFISCFGNVLSPLILSFAEFRERYRKGDALIREVVDAGRVVLANCSQRSWPMNPKKIPTRGIDRRKYAVYLKKAQDFYRAMRRSMDEENWNSAGLEAVHCAISAMDAVLAYVGGIRSTSQDHGDAVQLLRDTVGTRPRQPVIPNIFSKSLR